MNVSIKKSILSMVAIITLCSVLGYMVLIYNTRNIGKHLRLETQRHIKALIKKNAEKVEATMLVMEKTADDMATTGETFFEIQKNTDGDITEEIKRYLINNFGKLPQAIGGGLWYEPYTLFEKKKYYGPYAYRENNRVLFTWDLNTPKYDYHNQSWYVLAIPQKWDRALKRPKRIYWTAPYFDEAATQELMITVDALMYGQGGKLIGMATVDFSLKDLKEMVAKMVITPNSSAFAVDISSNLLIAFSSDPAKVLKNANDLNWGEKIQDVKDLPTEQVAVKPIKLQGEDFSLYYTMTNTGVTLGILAPHKELFAHLNRLNRTNMATSVVVLSVQIILFLLICVHLVRRICNPLSNVTGVAQEIAAGNLASASKSLALLDAGSMSVKDEIGRLVAAFHNMVRSLSTLFGQVQLSGNQITSSSNEIASSSRQLEATVTQQAASTNQVSVTSKEISATAGQLASTMNEATAAASETAILAESGQAGVKGMEMTLQGVLKATDSISSRLAETNQNASEIGTIVTTITKVADQTNLLSLNAAIEAEKAGEYGFGFAVVAREMRRLADQTAVAVLDIEEMINRMQSSADSGAREMETFTAEMRSGVQDIGRVGEQLAGIMERVQDLMPRFEAVNEGMEVQSESAAQISETIEQLSIATQSIAESLHEFKHAADELNDAALGLQEEVSRFKLVS